MFVQGEQAGSGSSGAHSCVLDSGPPALSSIVHPRGFQRRKSCSWAPGMLASVALTCSLCPPCPHSFGRDPDFESWLGNLHLKLWLLPLSHSMFSILLLAFLQFWPYLWPSSVFPFPAFSLIRLPICVTTLCLSSLHCGSISWLSFLNAICSSTQICFSVGSPEVSEDPVFQPLLSSVQSVSGDQLPFPECLLRWLLGTFSFGCMPAAVLHPSVLFLHFYPLNI